MDKLEKRASKASCVITNSVPLQQTRRASITTGKVLLYSSVYRHHRLGRLKVRDGTLYPYTLVMAVSQ